MKDEKKQAQAPKMKMVKVKPCKGFRVRKPDGDFLKDEGEMVPASTYWQRRLNFGEIELVGVNAKEQPKKEEPKKEEKKQETKKDDKKGESK